MPQEGNLWPEWLTRMGGGVMLHPAIALAYCEANGLPGEGVDVQQFLESRIWGGFLAILITAMAGSLARAKVTFSFDYSNDTSTLFGNTVDGIAAKATLERAAQVFSDRLLDPLTPINATTNSWSAKYINPSTGNSAAAADLSVAANTIKIYVGGRPLGTDLGSGGPGGYDLFTNNAALKTAIRTRGQSGADAATPTDFGTWGGSIAFNSALSNWNFTASAPATGKNDFYSAALHEIAHVLGIGTAGSWNAQLTPTVTTFGDIQYVGPFAGTKSAAIFGGSVPLQTPPAPASSTATVIHAAHFSSGTTASTGFITQALLMSPTLPTATRRQLTLLDWAALDDIGWDLARPGDANADGSVDLNDLIALANHYGDSAGALWSTGDFNYDGAVNLNDLIMLANNYGSSGPLGAEQMLVDWAGIQGGAVPEPGGAGVVFVGLALVSIWKGLGRKHSSQHRT